MPLGLVKSSMRSILVPVAMAVGLVFAMMQPLSAQAPVDVRAFLGNPGQLLQDNPTGGARLLSRVRDLAIADPATLQPILNLLATANSRLNEARTDEEREAIKAQKAAIGAGLAQAARILVRNNQQAYATQIQRLLLETQDQDAVLAFASIAGDQPIGAVAAAAAGGAIGGQTNPLSGNPSGTGPALPIGGGSVNTGQFTYSSSVAPLSNVISTSQ